MILEIKFDEYSPFYGFHLKNLTNLTIFLGQNNSGKTQLLDYIYEKFQDKCVYISLEEFAFYFSDKTVNVPKEIFKLRQNKIQRLLEDFNLLDNTNKDFVLNYFKELTDIDIKFHNGIIQHFIEVVGDKEFFLDIYEIGNAYIVFFAILVEIFKYNKPVILIDEPEIGLHAKMQKRFFNVLKKIIEKNNKQIFIATHSSLFIDKENPKNNFKIKNQFGFKKIMQLQSKQDIYVVIYNLLGNSPSDLFMPSNFIIVEGPSDKAFLVRIMKRFYSHLIADKNIIVQPAYGDITNKQVKKTLSDIEKLFDILENNPIYRDRVVILVDMQDKKVFNLFKQHFKLEPERLRTLGEIGKYALEEAYPPNVLLRVARKHNIKLRNPKEIARAILKNKRYKKIQWAKWVGEEIRFDEVPKIFKQVIEKAIELSL